jgi:bud site selection protein 20
MGVTNKKTLTKTRRKTRYVVADSPTHLDLLMPYFCGQIRAVTDSCFPLRDLDQVMSDLRDSKHLAQHKDTKAVEDLPGLGQWYCIECAKWFEGENSLVTHRRGKTHKRRVKALKDEPYTQKEAEAAVGIRTDNGKRRSTHTFDIDMETSDQLGATHVD